MSKTRKLPDPIIPRRVGSATGEVTFGATTYKFPTSSGGQGQVLTTTGQGQLVWVDGGSAAVTKLTIKDVFSDYTLEARDTFIRYRGTEPGTIALPKCSTSGGLQLIIQNCSEVMCTIVMHAGDTFDGDGTPLVLDHSPASASLICNGLDTWLLI